MDEFFIGVSAKEHSETGDELSRAKAWFDKLTTLKESNKYF